MAGLNALLPFFSSPRLLYALDVGTDYLRAWGLSGVRQATRDINLNAGAWDGVVATATRIYALDDSAGYLRAWDFDGNRQAADDFSLLSIQRWVEAAATPTRIYAMSDSFANIRVFDHSGAHQSGEDFDTERLSGGQFGKHWGGVAATPSRIYGLIFNLSGDGEIRAWDHSGAHQSGEDITLTTGTLRGLTIASGKFYVVDDTSNYIRVWTLAGVRQQGDDIPLGDSLWSGVTVTQ